jgi:hypothetical protein
VYLKRGARLTAPRRKDRVEERQKHGQRGLFWYRSTRKIFLEAERHGFHVRWQESPNENLASEAYFCLQEMSISIESRVLRSLDRRSSFEKKSE